MPFTYSDYLFNNRAYVHKCCHRVIRVLSIMTEIQF